MFPIVLALWWLLVGAVTGLSLPLPCQNTSELEGGGDGHQSSINTLPDISLVRHRAMPGWLEASPMVLGSASVSLCYITDRWVSPKEINWIA